MDNLQIWERDGLGVDADSLKKVLETFKEEGTQGLKSQMALKDYLTKADDDALLKVYEMDPDTMTELLATCFGARIAFAEINRMTACIKPEKVDSLGWISPDVYAEVAAKYEKRVKDLNEEKDRILSASIKTEQRAEKAEEKILLLQDELEHYKAALYDFYVKEGKLPKYERRQKEE